MLVARERALGLRTRWLEASVRLIRALGGGWTAPAAVARAGATEAAPAG